MILARYTKLGAVDTFGFGGVSSAQYRSNASEGIDAIGIQRSTQIVVAGTSHISGNYQPFVGRFNWSGVRDDFPISFQGGKDSESLWRGRWR